MRKFIKKVMITRLRMDLRDNSPMVALYVFGMFIEAGKYKNGSQFFEEISEAEYLKGLSK